MADKSREVLKHINKLVVFDPKCVCYVFYTYIIVSLATYSNGKLYWDQL